jgi:Na+-transporting NADH:ubiquinone oxidoreductase subunit NqrC
VPVSAQTMPALTVDAAVTELLNKKEKAQQWKSERERHESEENRDCAQALVGNIDCKGLHADVDEKGHQPATIKLPCGTIAGWGVEHIWVKNDRNEIIAAGEYKEGEEPVLEFNVPAPTKWMFSFVHSSEYGLWRSETFMKKTHPLTKDQFHWGTMGGA